MLALRPAIVDFFDTLTHTPGREMQLEHVVASQGSSLAGLTVRAARENGITILAMEKKDGGLLLNPPDEQMIDVDDRLVVIGAKSRLATLG